MAQTARPDADVSQGDWTDDEDNSDPLYQQINETSSIDDNYIKVNDEEGMGEELSCEVGLGDVTDPDGASGTYKFVVRSLNDSGMGGETIDAQLKQGSNVRATLNMNVNGSFTNYTHSLSSSEISACGTFANLSIKLIAQDLAGAGGEFQVSSVYFECPDAPAASATTSPAFLLFIE